MANKYMTLLLGTPETRKERELVAQNKRAGLQLQQDIAETELAVEESEEKLAKALLAVPFSSKNIVAAQLEVEEFKAGLSRLNKLKDEYFTDVEEAK